MKNHSKHSCYRRNPNVIRSFPWWVRHVSDLYHRAALCAPYTYCSNKRGLPHPDGRPPIPNRGVQGDVNVISLP